MADSNWSVRIGTRVTDDIQKQLDTMPKKTVTVKAVLDNTGLKTIGTTELTKYEDALGNVVVANKKFDASGKELNNTIKSVKSTVDTTSQTLQTASKHTKTLGQDFIATAGKVAKFGAITAIFGLVTTAIGTAISSVKELDSAMVEFKKVSSLSGSGLDNYTKKLGELGLEVARTKEEMVEASTEFVKAGYTEEESAKLAKTASLFQNIADTELSASEASTVLISNMKAFGMTSADSERVVDVINEVSNVFAVSSSDISAGLSKTASAMSTLGNTYEQSIALMVGAGEQMPNQSGKIARGLRSIGLEIVKTAQKTKELDTGYRDVTLSLYDQNGALKSTFDIMSELYPTWEKMTNEQKTNLGISLAGKQQYEVFSATMEGFDQVLKANEVGLNAMGSAMKENEAYMDGIEAKTKLLKAQFDLLVNGDGGLNSFIKNLLDGATGILKFANDTDLLKVALIDIGIILTVTLIPKLITFGSTILANIGNLALFTAETGSLALGLKAVGISASVAQIALGGFIAVLTVGAMAWNGYKSAQEEAERATKESISSTLSEIESLEQINQKLEDETLTREALYSLIKGTDAYSSEMEDIKDVNELRQEAIDKIKEEQMLKAQQLVDTGLTSYQKALYNQSQDGSNFRYTPYSPVHMQEFFDAIDNASGTQAQIEAISNYKNAVVKLREEHKEGTFDYKQYTKAISMSEAELSNLYATQQEDNALISDFNNSLSILGQKYDEVTGEIVDLTQAEIDNISKTKESTEAQEEQASSLSDYEKSLKDLDATLSILSGTTISGLADAFSLLKDAQAEINDTGSLSIDTYESLMNLGAEYQAILFDENGQLRLNEESVTAVYNAKIDEMAITSARNMVDLAGQLSSEGKSFADLANDTGSATKAGWEQIAVMMAELELSEKDSKALQVRIDGIKQWAKQAKANIGTYSGSTSAIKKNTSAVKDNNDELENQIDNYKKVFGYMEDQIDKYIEKIEKRRDVEVDAIDAQIDALEKQNDVLQDQIDKEEALKNIAEAKDKKVYVLTNGRFQYVEDVEAVSKAQEEYNTLIKKQQYDKQVSDLEDYKDAVENQYDKQIEIYKNYKNQFADMTQAYELEQTRLLAEQLTGLDLESDLWITRLTNLSSYVNKYNALQKQLGSGTTNNSASTGSGGSSGGGSTTTSNFVASKVGMPSDVVKNINNKTKYVASKAGMPSSVKGMQSYATGISSIGSNQIARVGENPNSELVIGSKANGSLMSLSKGSGVVNAESTKTFAGLLNMLGNTMNGGISNVSNNNSINSSKNDGINIYGSINVTANNVDEFAESIKRTFRTNMIQKAYE